MNSLVKLRQFELPVLDLFGSKYIEQVLVHRDGKRDAALSVANRNFVQVEIEGANHFFDDPN